MKSKFRDIKKMLTRDEMKQIKGGTGWSTCGQPCSGIFGDCGDYTFFCNYCDLNSHLCREA